MGYGSSGRGNATMLWPCIHTTEGARSAPALANFFNGNPNASSHVGIDASQILWMVPRGRAAWTLGTGNPYSVNAELCAFAGWSRAQWLSTGTVDGCHNPRGIIRNAAAWTAGECDYWGIPRHMLGARAVSGWLESIIDHHDYTQGSGWGSHWDVGEGFPFDVFLADLNGTAPPADAPHPDALAWTLPTGHYYGDVEGPTESHGGYYVHERPQVRRIQQRFQELGHAPSYAGWADGIWEQPTTDACNKWQAATGRRVTGRVYEDDWYALFPQEDDMKDDERAAIFTMLSQMTGSTTPWEFPGWQSFVPGSEHHATLTDYVRSIDAHAYHTRNHGPDEAAHSMSNWHFYPGPGEDAEWDPNERNWVQSWETRNNTRALIGQVTALSEAVKQLSSGNDLDLQAVQEAAAQGVRDAKGSQ